MTATNKTVHTSINYLFWNDTALQDKIQSSVEKPEPQLTSNTGWLPCPNLLHDWSYCDSINIPEIFQAFHGFVSLTVK